MKPIGQSIFNNHLFLKKLSFTKSDRKRRQLLRLATNEELLAIIEIALNILKGRFELSPKQKYQLLPYASTIRQISRAKTPKGIKKVLQTGGGLSILPALIAPVIVEIIRSLSSRES